jgi:hypothetical protein
MKNTLAILAIATVSSANAILVIDTHPGNIAGTENILLNDTGLLSFGPVVQGLTNESLLIVDFYDAGEDLLAGKARVTGADGGITQLSVAMNDPELGIAAYQFNLDALGSGDVTISAYDHGMLAITETFMLDEQGPNWFSVYGTKGESVSSITISSTVELASVRNNRVFAVPNPVPEPSGFLALGLGLTALVALRKRQ